MLTRRDEGGRRPARWFLAAIAGPLAIGALAVGLTYSPIFGARTIRMVGADRVDRPSLLRVSGIHAGMNVFHLDASAAELRLKADPHVADASVTGHLPSTILIVVSERIAVATAIDAAGRTELVGADGVAMGPATGEAVPSIVGEGAGTPSAADLRLGAGCAAALPTALRAQVRTVAVAPGGDIEVVMRSGVVVSYGPPTDLEAKARVLSAVLRWAQEQGRALTSIDVSVLRAPTATEHGTTASAPSG